MTSLRVDVAFASLERVISDAIAVLSSEGIVTAWSAAAASLTGIGHEAAQGKSLDQLFSRVEPSLGFAPVPASFTVWSKDETRRALHATALSIEDGWFLSFGAQQRFDAIDRLKSEIVTAVSHELKTPIATIKAFATTLRENPDNTAHARGEYLATIEHEADRLAHAVEQLLLAARVDAQHLMTRRERVSADALLDRALERIGASAAARIERHTQGVALSCDPELLAQAVANVIDNALKFSSDGSPIAIEAEHHDEGTTLRVRDRGIGIATEHLPYIFERFYRVERTLSASTGGYGLGLFVAREIAQAHGGKIEVESAPRQGTTFTLRIPERA